MAQGRLKVYGRKRARQSSSSGSSANQPEEKSSSTPPLDATITLDDMARKMRRRAARGRRSSSNSKRKSAASSKEFDQPAPKRPKLARTDSMQVDAPAAKFTALSSVSPSERNILAGLSSGPQRRHGQTPVTSSMFAKENRDEEGRVLSRSRTGSAQVPMSAPAAGPGPSSARLASPLRLSTSGDPFSRRRQHTAAARHSYAPGRAVRSRVRQSDAAVASFSSTRRRTSAAQPQKKRLSNSWLLSPPNIRLEAFSGYAGLDPLPQTGTSDNAPGFSFARPTAFSTPTRAKKLKRRAGEVDSDDMMQLDEPPAFLNPSSQPDAPSAASSRKTHASVPSPFQFSAAVSAIDSAVLPIRAPTSPLRYATPVRPATPAVPVPPAAVAHSASDEEEQRSDGEARDTLATLEPSPASSGGDELRDMFNVLGLDEDERWTRLTSESDFSLDLFKPPSPAAQERTVTRARSRRAGGARSVRFAPPTIKMRTLSSPLKSSTSGSEDELLLKAGDMWVDPDSEL